MYFFWRLFLNSVLSCPILSFVALFALFSAPTTMVGIFRSRSLFRMLMMLLKVYNGDFGIIQLFLGWMETSFPPIIIMTNEGLKARISSNFSSHISEHKPGIPMKWILSGDLNVQLTWWLSDLLIWFTWLSPKITILNKTSIKQKRFVSFLFDLTKNSHSKMLHDVMRCTGWNKLHHDNFYAFVLKYCSNILTSLNWLREIFENHLESLCSFIHWNY